MQKRLLEIAKKHKLAHISSSLSVLGILDRIYRTKGENEHVVLGNGHAALGLYVVMEKHGLCNAEDMVRKYGTHAHRCENVSVTSGSLGQAETVAVGMAWADRSKNIYLITSDGGCAEGSVWEALRVASELKLDNLKVYVIANGYSALGSVDTKLLSKRLKTFFPVKIIKPKIPPQFDGIDGHYITL
jgi:transketolase